MTGAEWAVRDRHTGAIYPQPNKQIAETVADLHGACQVIPLAPPGENEREALADLIEGVGVYIPGSHGHDYINPGKAANAVFGGGFRRESPERITEQLVNRLVHKYEYDPNFGIADITAALKEALTR